MNDIYKYIDEIFRDIVKSKESKRLKEQMRTGAKEKYEILVSDGIGPQDAVIKVINEIGTADDLKAEYPVKNKVLNIVGCVFTVLLIISISYSVYVLANKSNFIAYGNPFPVYLYYSILKQFNYMAIPFVMLILLNRISSDAKMLLIKNKVIRIAVLVVCVCATGVYFLNAASMLFDLYSIPSLIYNPIFLLMENSYIFILFGILLFYGIKSIGDSKRGVS